MKESSAELLAQMQTELRPLKLPLGKAADTVVDEGVSNYPVFVVHKQQVSIGIPIINHEEHGVAWSVNVSTLEEFVTKNLIQTDRIDEFREVFKPVKEHLCLFVLSELGATFVFLPRN